MKIQVNIRNAHTALLIKLIHLIFCQAGSGVLRELTYFVTLFLGFPKEPSRVITLKFHPLQS